MEQGVPFLRVTDIVNDFSNDNKKYISEEEHSMLVKRCNPRKGDILFSKNGTIGIAKLIDWDWPFSIFVSLALIRIKRDGILPKYLEIWLNSSLARKEIYIGSKQGTVTNLHLEEINRFRIAIPPIQEQKKIAEVLSTWDLAIEKTEALIKEKENLKKGLMQKLLTGKVRFKEFIEKDGFKDTKIGMIPEDWDAVNIGELGQFYRGKGVAKSELRIEGFPCITYGQIYTTNLFYTHSFNTFINEQATHESEIVENGDILFAGSGETLDEIGKSIAYLGNEKAFAGGDIIILRNEKADSHFLSFLLNSQIFFSQSRKKGQGHSVVHIYPSGLRKIKVPIPKIDEQKMIAKTLFDLDGVIENLYERNKVLSETKKGLMQQLLTGKTRVKVDDT